MADLPICPTCEEAPRTLRGDLRVGFLKLVIEDNSRLRDALKDIATRCAETEIGFLAERALMSEEQRAAVDAARSAALPSSTTGEPK